jgi:L-ascorbate metabolism protein UlaG (beta-lactamase superfamily)
MKLTKFGQSCVLIEDDNGAILLDPGSFSEGKLSVADLPPLQAVVVTHQHADHLSEKQVKELVSRFPDVQWVAPADTHDQLKGLGVSKVTNQSVPNIEVNEGLHAPIAPLGDQIQNLVVHINGKVTHPGDSHDFTQTKEVLLLPIDAPWGTTIKALSLAQELHPKYVLPIHDGMWNDQWRQSWYNNCKGILAKDNIDFLIPEDGQPIEIDV